MAIHSINFAVFRMDPNAQLWGWLVSYAIYDMLAILLPSIALEHFNLTEKVRMQKLVDERTLELNESLKTNEGLLKVLIHDISNPLMVMKGYLYLYNRDQQDKAFSVDKIQKAQIMIEEIIEQVKGAHRQKNQPMLMREPCSIDVCFNEISFMFEDILKQKNIALRFTNHLDPGTLVLADQVSLTHSVLSNLVSNGIKFSAPNSQIVISAKESNHSVILEVRDEGPGIPQETILDVLQNKESKSTNGTLDEKGSGLGLSIVKSCVDSYGGQLEFDSHYIHTPPKNYGTNIRITLDRA